MLHNVIFIGLWIFLEIIKFKERLKIKECHKWYEKETTLGFLNLQYM